MRPIYCLCFFAGTFLLATCSRDTLQVFPADFKPFVDEFFQDAQLRGHDLLLEDFDLTIGFRNSYRDDRLGQCVNTNRHKITVRKDYWDAASFLERRHIIYHELGHCILNQQHRGEADSRGYCNSLMAANDEVTCSYNLVDSIRWDYLVDELFDPFLEFEYSVLPFFTTPDSERNYLVSIEDSLVTSTIEVGLTEQDLANDFTITASRSITNHYTYRLGLKLGNTTFNYCRCSGRSVSIYSIGQEAIYESREAFSEPVRLSLQRRNDQLNFYINELFVYTMPAQGIEENSRLSLSPSLFSSEPPPHMDLKVYK